MRFFQARALAGLGWEGDPAGRKLAELVPDEKISKKLPKPLDKRTDVQ